MGIFALEKGSNGRSSEKSAERVSAFRAREPSRIGQFIQRMLLGERPEGKPVRLTLSHVGPGGRPDALLGSQSVDELTEEQIAKLAVEVYAHAENDAAGLGHTAQRYVLQSYYETDPGNPSGRIVFQIMAGQGAGAGESPDSIDSDPPTSTGLVSQVMRQNEHLHSQLVGVMEGVVTLVHAQAVQMDRMSDQINRFMAERLQQMDEIEKARSAQWSRHREAKRDEMEFQVKSELLGSLKMLAPALARRLTGAKVPDAPVPEREQLLELARSFNEDQIMRLAGEGVIELSPAQKLAFLEWYKLEGELDEVRRKGAAPSKAEPEKPAAPAAPAAPAPAETPKE